MVSLSTARSANASLVQKPIVAVFSGATSGIGELTARALAALHGSTGKGLRIYLLGRNSGAADETISYCKLVCPDGEFIFVQARDFSLLKDVDKACHEVIEMEEKISGKGSAKIDLLYISHADLHFRGRRNTIEGLDKSLSYMYYSRMRMIMNFLPLLLVAPQAAHIVSVYAGGSEKKLPQWSPDDIDLHKPDNYSLTAYRTHSTIMKTFFFEKLAKQHPGRLSLVHVYPGLVITPAFNKIAWPVWWYKAIFESLRPALKLFVAIPLDQIGDKMLFLASDRFPARDNKRNDNVASSTDGISGGGAYSINDKGETNDLRKTYAPLRQEGMDEKLWQHTISVFEQIDKHGKVDGS